MLISNIAKVFKKTLAQKYPDTAFFIPNLDVFRFFLEILLFDKFEGADFKYDNIVVKFQLKTTQIRHFWSRTSVFLFLHQTF